MTQAASPPIPLVQDLMPLLRTRHFGRAVRSYDHAGSTNTLAALWAREEAPEGAFVIAEYQTAGRGRLGRTWEAAPGRNLTFSLILRPSLPPSQLGSIVMGASLAVAEAVEVHTAPLRPQVKWPNDVLLAGRKCCGMLLESSLPLPPSGPGFVLLGIGLNVNQDAFPPGLASSATSLLLETGRLTPRAPLLADLLRRLEQHYTTLLREAGRVHHAYQARLAGVEQPITLRLPATGARVHGTLKGVTDTGALLLQTETGLHAFHAGDVSFDLL